MTAQEIFAAILKNRGIKIEDFSEPKYEDLHDPLKLPSIQPALNRLQFAHENKEKIVIYGDYDIDGLTATTLLKDALGQMGFTTDAFIPDRYIDGYGLSRNGVEEIKKMGGQLIITVDCGTNSAAEIDYAKSLGIDVIVTDHHTQTSELSKKAVAVVNPKRKGSRYPFKDLAGVGVAFKLVQAMQKSGFVGLEEGQEKWLLDLVALGTVCDVVDLIDENRILVYFGLKVMKKTKRPGIRALAEVSQSQLDLVSPETLGFRFGPRLNASGRLDHARSSLDLLTTDDQMIARGLADNLNHLNYERRSQQNEISKLADQQAADYSQDKVLVLSHSDWAHGIVGIVASRMVEKHQKPTFLLQEMDKEAKGSGRSFGDFHLAEALAANKDILISGGGHSAAAGVTINNSDIDSFRKKLNEHYNSLKLSDQTKYLETPTDAELTSFDGLDEELMTLLEQLQPWGMGNQQPLFEVSEAILESWKPVGADQTHAKMTIKDDSGISRDSIGFGMAQNMPEQGSRVTLKFYLETNTFNGKTSLQHRVLSIRAV